MSQRPHAAPLASAQKLPIGALFILVTLMFTCSAYANLSFAVTNPEDYRFFPPFEPSVNLNANKTLGAEYGNIAHALAAGRGFSDPFIHPSGPTAWQPPVYPLFLAGLFWLFDGNLDAVVGVVLFMQVFVLIGTGLLVVGLVRETTKGQRAYINRTGMALAVYVGVVLWNFRLYFQRNQDGWLVLGALDVIIAGLYWCRPLSQWKTAAPWGLVGGLCAMINPIAGFCWGALTIASGIRHGAWSRLGLALSFFSLALAPWTIRNYLVFGRFIPFKSNLAFELYQSQCLQAEGVLNGFGGHPYMLNNQEGNEYLALGEIGFLDHKWEQFRESVSAKPLDYAVRMASRFLAATSWFTPFGRTGRPWVLALKRVTHVVPFLALLFLLLTAIWRGLHPVQWLVIGVYILYLLPYIVISYYERYATPILVAKVLLVVWATDRLLCLGNWHKFSAVPGAKAAVGLPPLDRKPHRRLSPET